LKRLQKCQEEDPCFDSKDDETFRRAIRSLSIYDYKVSFLADKGFDKAWGCPNENFFKLIESYKSEDIEYKKKVVLIEKSYEKAIEEISNDPSICTEEGIEGYFHSSNPKPVIPPKMQ